MRRSILFYSYLAQSRFAEALAQLYPGTWPRTGLEQVACYRLDMYDTVSNSPWDGKHLQGGVAVAVSLAACGRHAEATDLIHRLLKRHGPGRYQAELADALAPFMPALALPLVDNARAPQALRAALLLRTGAKDEAAHRIQAALAAHQGRPNPELHLLATNALDGTPAQELTRMNAFLARFALPPLALRDPDRPPGTTNLVAAETPAAADGPLVSVVMTAYNTAERIGAALAGLLAQSWRNLEVVVVDDCSTDGTADVVRALAEQDPRVKYMRQACNAGTYVAKTVGLHRAAGEFVTCHDSDDWSHPLRIERQMRPLLDNRRLVASTSQWVRIEDDGTFYARPVHPLSRLNPASPLFRRQEVLARAGLWDAVRTGADSEFHSRLRLVFGRQAVYRLAQPLAFGAHRADSLMNAADTGYSVAGLSPQRLAYWEGWTRWHIAELYAGRKPMMPAMGTPDSDAAASLPGTRVPREAVRACLEAAGVC